MRRTIILAGAVLALATTQVQAQNLKAKAEEKGKAAMKGMMGGASAPTKAVAVIHGAKGSEINGTVTFTKVAGGIRVVADLHGVPAGMHGFHVHEFGDVSTPEFMSAGGHFNPMKAEHGEPKAEKRHVGDMGNIEASARGVAKVDYVDPHMTFSGMNSILGRAVILHEKPDDYKQPTGNAGGRIAAGVIGVAKPE